MRKSYLEKSLVDLKWKENGKAVHSRNATSHLRLNSSSCSWKAPYSLHTSRSVLYVRSLNTLAKFLTNHYRSNSLRNRSFSYFRSLSNFLDELTRKHLLRNLPRYLSDALLFLIDIYYSLFAANLPIGKISSLFDRRRSLSKNLLDKIVNSNSYNAMNS